MDGAVIGAPRRVLVVTAGMEAEDYVWATHDTQDSFLYRADFTRWLAAAGTTLASVTVSRPADQLLIVGAPTANGGVVDLIIAGGTAGTTAPIGLRLTLASGCAAEFVVSLPIVARGAGLTPVPPGTPPVAP